MKTVIIIKSEHRSLQAMLYTMEQLVRAAESGAKPDFKILHGIVTYIDKFTNSYHHPKEDNYLLPMLLLRHPPSASLVAEIYEEHIKGDKLFVDMVKALSAYEFTGDLSYSGFPETVYEYTQFERAHAMKEEELILKRAVKYFEAPDWEEIDSRFDDNTDPVFGKQAKSKFRDLYTFIVNRVPAPYGLGAEWSKSEKHEG